MKLDTSPIITLSPTTLPNFPPNFKSPDSFLENSETLPELVKLSVSKALKGENYLVRVHNLDEINQ